MEGILRKRLRVDLEWFDEEKQCRDHQKEFRLYKEEGREPETKRMRLQVEVSSGVSELIEIVT